MENREYRVLKGIVKHNGATYKRGSVFISEPRAVIHLLRNKVVEPANSQTLGDSGDEGGETGSQGPIADVEPTGKEGEESAGKHANVEDRDLDDERDAEPPTFSPDDAIVEAGTGRASRRVRADR